MSALQRLGAGDALIGLALVALLVAALLPTYRARAFERTVGDAAADVDALAAASLRLRATSGQWPDARPVGLVPAGAASIFGNDSTMTRDGYTLEWRLMNRVAYVEAPPSPVPSGALLDDDETPAPSQAQGSDPVPDSAVVEMVPTMQTEGAVVVHSDDALLLAELLRRYGGERSFVRDTTWILRVPRS